MTGVPFTFATATTAIPLSELDVCFATPVTIGSSSVGLGNSISSLSGLVDIGATGNATVGGTVTVTGAAATGNLTVTSNIAASRISLGGATTTGTDVLGVSGSINCQQGIFFPSVQGCQWGAANFVAGSFASNYVQVIAGGTGGVQLSSGGTSWGAICDERKKTNLVPILDAVAKLRTLRAVTGRYKNDEEGASRAFLIAQDVQKVLPEAVTVSDDEDQTLILSSTDVIPLLVAAINALSAEVQELKKGQTP